MKRVSKLELLVKLARHEESRTLRKLGEARAAVTGLDQHLARIRTEVAASLRDNRVSRLLRFAADLTADERHRGSLRFQAAAVVEDRERALLQVEEARQEAARARMRVRGIENAIERRAKRERLERERSETRRLDETVRQMQARSHDSEQEANPDALA